MYSISGTLYCKSESECKAKSDEMLSFVETMFKGKYELNTWQENHGSDKSGKSIVYGEEIFDQKVVGILRDYKWVESIHD